MTPKLPLPPDLVREDGLVDGSTMTPSITSAERRLRQTAFRMRTVDAVTTELVRIRNARFQRCFY